MRVAAKEEEDWRRINGFCLRKGKEVKDNKNRKEMLIRNRFRFSVRLPTSTPATVPR
jgi:hypothetical protein